MENSEQIGLGFQINRQLQEHGRAFPPNHLHETWHEWLYWDVELEA